jgi:hypothetical protein
MMALGSNVHLFARPDRREELRRLFADVLQAGSVADVRHPAMPEPMLIVRFSGGGSLSIEFIERAPDSEEPRLGAWLELRTEDPEAAMRRVLGAGFPEVKHPGHPYYFMAPGGQVFTVVPFPGVP